jgi:type I restriction enzyme M protein
MDQERRTMHGHKSPRADIVIWETQAAKAEARTPVLVIERKAEAIDINIRDYYQGESYTRAARCEFFVATNARFPRHLQDRRRFLRRIRPNQRPPRRR